jgi:hypothetical protein
MPAGGFAARRSSAIAAALDRTEQYTDNLWLPDKRPSGLRAVPPHLSGSRIAAARSWFLPCPNHAFGCQLSDCQDPPVIQNPPKEGINPSIMSVLFWLLSVGVSFGHTIDSIGIIS